MWTSPFKELVVWEPEKIWRFVEKVSGNRSNKQSLVVMTLCNNMLIQKKVFYFSICKSRYKLHKGIKKHVIKQERPETNTEETKSGCSPACFILRRFQLVPYSHLKDDCLLTANGVLGVSS